MARTRNAASSDRKLTPEQMAAIQDGVDKAGLKGFKINSMHLSPVADAAASQGNCHSQQLPNGHWIIVCD
jgi:hypothetical protein